MRNRQEFRIDLKGKILVPDGAVFNTQKNAKNKEARHAVPKPNQLILIRESSLATPSTGTRFIVTGGQIECRLGRLAGGAFDRVPHSDSHHAPMVLGSRHTDWSRIECFFCDRKTVFCRDLRCQTQAGGCRGGRGAKPTGDRFDPRIISGIDESAISELKNVRDFLPSGTPGK